MKYPLFTKVNEVANIQIKNGILISTQHECSDTLCLESQPSSRFIQEGNHTNYRSGKTSEDNSG